MDRGFADRLKLAPGRPMSDDVESSAIRAFCARIVTMGAAVVLLGLTSLAPRESAGRLRPYYVVNAITGTVTVKPRVLFVLDTSGSMAWKAQSTDAVCAWDDCETAIGTVKESRISAAKRTIQAVVAANETAHFSLMTFDRFGPRTSTTLPPKCEGEHRFAWVDQYYAAVGYWKTVSRATGVTGTWHLCQGSSTKPFPYLRWDGLGVGSKISANSQTGAVPETPLITTTSPSITNAANADRKVQWFDEYLGSRFQPNALTDSARAISRASSGDYGTAQADIDANVYGHDFYYWPYVDGFPGYAQFQLSPANIGANYGGVGASDDSISGATLYAPFYVDLSGTSITTDNWGPADAEAAKAAVVARTQPLIYGGVDASSGTPWNSAVGSIPSSATQSNAARSHTTVASYLKFLSTVSNADACAPTAAVLITDGDPSPGEGGSSLYSRISALRRDLGVSVYVVGFFLGGGGELNKMACAGAGACSGTCSSPCTGTPALAWDTCADPDNPATACAFVSNSAAELVAALSGIVARVTELDAPSGPGSSVGDFGVGAGGSPGEGDVLQTKVTAHTEYPAWKGHVERNLCDDVDAGGALLPACVTPSPEFEDEELEPTFGPCVQSRSWDAGVCLQQTVWTDRRLYTHGTDNKLIRIAASDGTARAGFVAELRALGVLKTTDADAVANVYAAYLLGRDAPGGWKLPGLANSAPIVVRRVPEYRTDRFPEVAIRDPHCGGRPYGTTEAGQLPESLYDFARDAWDPALRIVSPSRHYAAQEAVLVGDDNGVLHAFQLNSGNELWGLVPRDLLANLPSLVANGATAMGQPTDIEDHIYGVAATPNVAWVYDDSSSDESDHRWRNLAVVGMGAGGSEYYALDLSHMSPYAEDGPVEILWTTSSNDDAKTYDELLGETWSRPSISFHVPGESLAVEPDPIVVFAGGYATGAATSKVAGRVLVRADALTGLIEEYAEIPVPGTTQYETSFAVVADPAITSHCRSRFWAEAQEMYIGDPAGRLFRWDLGRETKHEADSGGVWTGVGQSALKAPFYACVGAGGTCSISARNPTEPFTLPPAVTALDRIESASQAGESAVKPNDQFLVALVSGSPDNDALPDTFHSSVYLLVDDHVQKKSGGFSVPANGAKTPPGTDAAFMRQALSDITRTRVFTPYEGAAEVSETATFSSKTRPIRAPRIQVSGVVDEEGTPIDDVEVYEIEFVVYEPPALECDPRFYDASNGRWQTDPGSTYQITYRVTADVQGGFDLLAGAKDGPADFAAGFETGLVLASVTQTSGSGCTNGLCGAQQEAPSYTPCDNNEPSTWRPEQSFAVAISSKQVQSFTAVE